MLHHHHRFSISSFRAGGRSQEMMHANIEDCLERDWQLLSYMIRGVRQGLMAHVTPRPDGVRTFCTRTQLRGQGRIGQGDKVRTASFSVDSRSLVHLFALSTGSTCSNDWLVFFTAKEGKKTKVDEGFGERDGDLGWRSCVVRLGMG